MRASRLPQEGVSLHAPVHVTRAYYRYADRVRCRHVYTVLVAILEYTVWMGVSLTSKFLLIDRGFFRFEFFFVSFLHPVGGFSG